MSSPFVSCWSVKGGSGTTAVAAALALHHARRCPQGALLVDLAGDAEATLGLPSYRASGVTDWLAAGAAVPPDGLARLEVPVADGLHLLPRGHGRVRRNDRAEVLASVLAADARPVVVDCGVVGTGSATDQLRVVGRPTTVEDAASLMAARATRSLLVTRACYLTLVRLGSTPVQPSGVVLVEEPGRALRAADVAHIVGRPVVATVAWHDSVARAIDSGVLATRLPKAFDELGRLAA